MKEISAFISLQEFTVACGFVALILFAVQCRSTGELSNESISPEEGSGSGTEVIQSQTSPEDSARIAREEKLTEIYKEELRSDYKSKANRLTNYYILAQQRFYAADYSNALIYINRAIAIQENAYLFALRGSIHLGLGMRENFVNDWKKALDMDENVPIPQSEYIIGALRSYGLIDDNLNKNFTP